MTSTYLVSRKAGKSEEPFMAITAGSRKCAIAKLERRLPDDTDLMRVGQKLALVPAVGHIAAPRCWISVKRGWKNLD